MTVPERKRVRADALGRRLRRVRELPPRGPFELVFLDGGGFKHAPRENEGLVLGLLAPGALLVMDDLTPGWPDSTPSGSGRAVIRSCVRLRC